MRTALLLVVVALVPKLALAQIGIGVVVPGVRVNIAPPALRIEVQPIRPSAGHVWIAGHWAWRGGAHVWMPGNWAMPPSNGYVWEPARWVNEGGAWVFYEGHWRFGGGAWSQPAQYEVEATIPPPQPLVEVRPAAPQPGWVWVAGHWTWHGRHWVWLGGHWQAAPRMGVSWTAAHWEPWGGRWRFVPGRWQ